MGTIRLAKGFPKQGKHPVGVGVNIATSSAYRPAARSLWRSLWPIIMGACRLLIDSICPKIGPRMIERRPKVGVPDDINLKTKPDIALEHIEVDGRSRSTARFRLDGRGV